MVFDDGIEGDGVRGGGADDEFRQGAGGGGLGGDRFIGDGAGLGVIEHEGEFVGFGAPVQRRDDDAGELAGPVQRRGFPAVLQQGDEMVAGFEAGVVERGDDG